MKKKHWMLLGFACIILAIAMIVKFFGTIETGTDIPYSADSGETAENNTGSENLDGSSNADSETSSESKEQSIINTSGTTLETRFSTPNGYSRTASEENSLTGFLRAYELKEDGSPVLLYNGKEKGNQDAHAAVFKLPIEEEDLQQCADSVMRIYAEYFYHTGQPEKIAFHFTNGFSAEYEKWRQGNRIKVDGNDVSWTKSAEADNSYDCFKKYLRMVFVYSGTLSMESECKETSLDDLQVGDVFLQGGSPGHVVMVTDICQKEDGSKAFLLAQGYMPAQEFHVLKNPAHEDDPWYYQEEITYPFHTPEYTFEKGSLKHPNYIK